MTLTEPTTLAELLAPPVVDYPDDGSVRPVQRHVWEPVETAALPPGAAPGLRGRSIAVIGGREATAAAVGAALTAAGASAHRLAPPAEGETGGFGPSTAAFHAAAGRLDGIVDLNVEESFDRAGADSWEGAFRQTVALLQACFPDWIAETDANRLFYLPVTWLGGRMGFGPDRVEQPLGGLWAGLAKGLPRELPNCNIRILDLTAEHSAESIGELVSRELYRWGAFEIGYHAGRRYSLRARHAQPGPPRRAIRPGDTVVMSGGGRGIGFALARSLAEDFGARVLVSGRGAVPDAASVPALALDDREFRQHRDERLREAVAGRRVPQVRAALEKLAQERELWANLAAARADGLRIEYVQCDITDPEQVGRLVAAAGDRLVGVVHNAGLDVPVRLPGKSEQTLSRVVRVKVGGFLNLLRAVADRPPLAFFCSTGSLTGRWGGMVGQLDYGAANEALSRLGLWASQDGEQPGRERRTPVSTVCWPTWERLGMITNYEATLRYMSAVDVREGLYHWKRELLGGGSGESTFIGDVGPAMLPSVLRGYRQDTGLPGIERLATSRHYLGEPLTFRPYGALSTAHLLRAEELPCCEDFRVDGEPALPVSLVLEYLRAAGEWVLPEQGDQLRFAELRDLAVELAELRMGPGRRAAELVRHAEGRWAEDGSWRVAVTLERSGRRLAAAELVFQAEPLTDVLPESLTGRWAEGTGLSAGTELLPLPGGGLGWTGHAFRLAAWRRDPDTGRWCATADPGRMSDLLLTSPAPGSELPLNQLENVLRAAWLCQVRDEPGLADAARRLTVERLRAEPPARTGGTGLLVGAPDGRDWTGHRPAGGDRVGRSLLQLTGLRFR
ncbi:KR domain-containing protein [Kitasatospora sp. NPDC093806]|uniref:KR domain-containing protein n=1 Tax=Kitasatospora sp. NPDC093806 TaxID=3155075 RepID=UPI0034207D85